MSNPPPLIHVETNALDHAFMTAFSPAAEPTPTVEGRLDHIGELQSSPIATFG